MTPRIRGFACVAAVLLLLDAAPAGAGPPTDQLKAQIERVMRLLEDPDLKKETRVRERRTAVRKIANEVFDFGETAKRSLARHWASRTAAEREEFVALFADLLERSYISRIEIYGGEKITYTGETIDDDQAIVRSKLVTKDGTDIPVEYRMLRRSGDRWLVYDVVIEGVSLIANYRAQFNKIITTSSYQELVRKMKTKQDEFHEEQARRTSQK
jgi:phospholipid transport system substrate-binding protein